MVYTTGYDGLIYSTGFLVGWPIVLFLIAERLRNLGKFTFAGRGCIPLETKPVRLFAASGTLLVVIIYLIAQMVGAGKLIELLFGLDYMYAVIIRRVDGVIRVVWRHVGHHMGTNHQSCDVAFWCHFHGNHGSENGEFQPRSDVYQSS